MSQTDAIHLAYELEDERVWREYLLADVLRVIAVFLPLLILLAVVFLLLSPLVLLGFASRLDQD